MEDVFFRLSCEHESLPTAEVKAVMEAERIPYKSKFSPPCIFRVSMPLKYVDIILKRSGMVFFCAKELVFCDANYDSIFKSCRDVDWSFISNKSFCVRVKRVLASSTDLSTRFLEFEIGRIISNSLSGSTHVNLKSPDVTIIGVLSGGNFILGVLLGESLRSTFYSRWVGNRPFIHPSSLDPIVSRLFVNLCRARRGEIFLDPFCGSGGFLIEAALIGCEVIGLDVDEKMLRGCKLNMESLGLKGFHLFLGDARKVPFKSVRYVATDPPYGRTASTKGMNLKDLLIDFFEEMKTLLSKDGYLCLASPYTIGLSHLGLSMGFNLIESHLMRVHKSLVREICIFKL
ncbi:MAG: methyltransferase domain-containing protein [Candidatus Methanomethylicia archaeon]